MTDPWLTSPWTPRDWQRAALPLALRARDEEGVVRAVTGAGKSVFLAMLTKCIPGKIVITTPTVKLVEDLSKTVREAEKSVGMFYTRAKSHKPRVIVCCNDSLGELSKKLEGSWGWIADECHGTECDQVKAAIESNTPAWRIGMTATPYRADENEELSLFKRLIYNYGPAEAIRDGVVVPPRVVHYDGGAEDLNQACLEQIQKAEGPGVVDALNITDAEEFATFLRANGITAKTVHSKLGADTIERRLHELETGKLQTIVHVSMLSEGVDLPWLRWLCCRRPIASRVRFAQFIGRGLRSLHPVRHAAQISKYGEKRYCVVYDMHNLFEKLSIDYEAILAGSIEDDSRDEALFPALELDFLVGDLKDVPAEPAETMQGVPVRIIDPTQSYIRRLYLAFQFRGFIDTKIGNLDWRSGEVTSLQLRRIESLKRFSALSSIPYEHRRALQIAIRASRALSKGAASDLIGILEVIGARGWPMNIDVEAA